MYSYNTRVRYSEIAEDKCASIVAIVNYFQDCCTFEAEDGGIGLSWLAERNTAWMLTGWQIHILRRPRYTEEIKVTTWACAFKFFVGKRSFTITNMDGEVLVYAMSEWAYVNTVRNLPEKNVPDRELEVYGITTSIEERFEDFGLEAYVKANDEKAVFKGKIQAPDIADMKEEAPIIITADNLDTNHHVNNGQYVALAKSVIPEEIDVKHFRAEIKRQSVLGDTIIPYIYRESDKIVVILNDEEGNLKLITEFYLS